MESYNFTNNVATHILSRQSWVADIIGRGRLCLPKQPGVAPSMLHSQAPSCLLFPSVAGWGLQCTQDPQAEAMPHHAAHPPGAGTTVSSQGSRAGSALVTSPALHWGWGCSIRATCLRLGVHGKAGGVCSRLQQRRGA